MCKYPQASQKHPFTTGLLKATLKAYLDPLGGQLPKLSYICAHRSSPPSSREAFMKTLAVYLVHVLTSAQLAELASLSGTYMVFEWDFVLIN